MHFTRNGIESVCGLVPNKRTFDVREADCKRCERTLIFMVAQATCGLTLVDKNKK